MMDKQRVIKDYDKLDLSVQQQIKLHYPEGFAQNLIKFTNKDGKTVSALPFEAEDKYYLVRMTVSEAQIIIDDDDDYNEDGILDDDFKDEMKDKV